MSVLSWKEQFPNAIAELREHLNRDFEYVGYHLTEFGFWNAMKRFMKSERARLKRQYQLIKRDTLGALFTSRKSNGPG
jgi:hypothetical protein